MSTEERFRILDLCCGPGGASAGYDRAGFEVEGVDLVAQPHYPFPFHLADALTFDLSGFDAVHVSPPCPRYATVTRWRGRPDDHPDLIGPLRDRLNASGLPWIMENVPGAPMRGDVMLCGTMFGLNVRRHRLFESNVPLFGLLPPCRHHRAVLPFMHKAERAFADAMECDWMSNLEARDAIPPAYTEHLGGRLVAHLVGLAA